MDSPCHNTQHQVALPRALAFASLLYVSRPTPHPEPLCTPRIRNQSSSSPPSSRVLTSSLRGPPAASCMNAHDRRGMHVRVRLTVRAARIDAPCPHTHPRSDYAPSPSRRPRCRCASARGGVRFKLAAPSDVFPDPPTLLQPSSDPPPRTTQSVLGERLRRAYSLRRQAAASPRVPRRPR